MNELPVAQPAEQPLPVYSRRERREMERAKKDNIVKDMKRREESVQKLAADIDSLTKIYAEGYNDYAKENPDNTRRLRGLRMPWTMNATLVPLSDLLESVKDQDISMYEQCMPKDKPGLVQVMYFRIDMEFRLAPDAEVKERPGVPEKVETNASGEKLHTQLFYHAVFPLLDPNNKYKINIAQEKLLNDFMVHSFCMGVDMQQMNNNNQWQIRLNKQTENMSEKAEEVMKIFSDAAEHLPS